MARRSVIAFVLLAALAAVGCTDPAERRLKSIERGHAHLLEQNYAKARVEFSTALQIEPDDPDTMFELARVHEKLGDASKAIRLYAGTLEVDETHSKARAELARMYTVGGYPEEAIALIDEMLPRFPRDPSLLIGRALANARLGNLEQARTEASIALSEDPGSERGTALLAGLLLRLGEAGEADALLEEGLETHPESTDLRVARAFVASEQGDNDRAAALLEETVRLKPDDEEFHYQLARFYLDISQVDAAESVLRRLIQLRPEAMEPRRALLDLIARERPAAVLEAEIDRLLDDPVDRPGVRLMLADFYKQAGNEARRQELLAEAIAVHGEGPLVLEARRRLATDLLQRGDIAAARESVERILEENPQDTRGLALLGSIELAEGETADAVQSLRTALAADPASLPVLSMLAEAYIRSGEYELAIEVMQDAQALAPRSAPIAMTLARAHLALGQPDRARSALERLADEAEVSPALLELLFEAQSSSGDVTAAAATARRYSDRLPQSATAAILLARAAEAEQAWAGAVANYRRALDIESENFIAVQGIARIAEADGNPALARDALERFVERVPDHAQALNLLSRIHLRSGNTVRAAALARQSIDARPDTSTGYASLALVHLESGEVSAAIDVYRRGFAATRNQPLAFSLAGLLRQQGDTEGAIAVYEAVLRDDSRSRLAANNLAMLLVDERGDDESVGRALALVATFVDASNPALLNTYGWVSYRAGNFAAALPALERASSLAPESATLRYHYAVALLAAGHSAEGRQQLGRALEGELSAADAAEARRLLEEADEQLARQDQTVTSSR